MTGLVRRLAPWVGLGLLFVTFDVVVTVAVGARFWSSEVSSEMGRRWSRYRVLNDFRSTEGRHP